MDFSREAPMKPVLFAALVAALPACAAAQEGSAGVVSAKAPAQAGCPSLGETPRASSALPARASTKPEPQLGSVASNARVPSHAQTPSLRAMRAASVKEAERASHAPAGTRTDCGPAAIDPARQAGEKQG
jgi:hypothetical protein